MSGIWPVNMAKPLLSPLLLENVVQRQKTLRSRYIGVLENEDEAPITATIDQITSTKVWETPSGAADLRRSFNQYTQIKGTNSTCRTLFRSVERGIAKKKTLKSPTNHVKSKF